MSMDDNLFSVESDDALLCNKLFGSDDLGKNTGLLEDDAVIVEKMKARKMKMITPEKPSGSKSLEKDIEKYKVAFTQSIGRLETIGNDADYKCAELRQTVAGNMRLKKQVDELQEYMISIKRLVNEFRSYYNTSTSLLAR
jgi:hypothetical protein